MSMGEGPPRAGLLAGLSLGRRFERSESRDSVIHPKRDAR